MATANPDILEGANEEGNTGGGAGGEGEGESDRAFEVIFRHVIFCHVLIMLVSASATSALTQPEML